MKELAGYLAAYDEKNSIMTVMKILDSGITAVTVAEQLTEYLRKLLIASVTGEGKEAQDAMKWSRRALLRAIEILADTQVKMKLMSRPTVLLEAAIAKILLPESEATDDAMQLRIDKLERKLAEAMSREQQVIIREVASDTPKPPRKKKTPPRVSPADRELWEKLQNEIHQKDLGIYNYIRNLKLIKNENGKLTLTAAKPSYIGFYEDWPRKDELFAMIEELTGSKYTIETIMPEDDLADIPEGVEILD